jgi:YQGE family putative transporter
MINKLKLEFNFFKQQPRQMRMLLLTNMIYVLVIPIIELFLSAYIIRSSQDFSLVMVYQLAQGTGIPLTFMLNGFLLKHFPIARLYAAGMILSAFSMGVMMLLKDLTIVGIAGTGLMMGMAYGLFWANRVFLSLTTTNDKNRNYFYGLEALFFTFASIVMPLTAGYLIASTRELGWFGGKTENAYYILTGIVLLLTIVSSVFINRGKFVNPENAKFVYFKFHRLWRKMLLMASLKGVAQGFVISAPVMLIMKLVGAEGSIGSIQSIGSVLSAGMLYVLGRAAKPKHRQKILAAGLVLFVIGSFINMTFYNAAGAIFFVGCLVFARPLLDLAYFPVQLGVIECVSAKEKRNQFAYIFSHEVGIYLGRVFGCLLFIFAARNLSEDIALRYVLFAVAVLQLFSIVVVKAILTDPQWCESAGNTVIQPNILKEPAELSS